MWRHMPDAKVLEIVDQLDPYVFKSRHFTKLILEYSLQCKFGIVEQLYRSCANMSSPVRRSDYSASICSSRMQMLFSVCVSGL
jgi:hypothetical protein